MNRQPRNGGVSLLAAIFLFSFALAPAAWSEEGEAAKEPDVFSFATANNQFALDLYGQLVGDNAFKGQNIVFSPYSITSALTMTLAGARGNTAKEMADVLGYPVREEGYDPIHADLSAMTMGLTGNRKENVFQAFVSNDLWLDKKSRLVPSFRKTINRYYKGASHLVDFRRQPEKARQKINKAIEKTTRKRIKDLIPSGAIDPTTRLVITNGVYLEAWWQDPFPKRRTKPAPFHVSPSKDVEVPMMANDGFFPHKRGKEFATLELPYKENRASMFIILPHEIDRLAAIEERLLSEGLDEFIGGLKRTDLDIKLPKFKLEPSGSYMLNKYLMSLGMADAFDQSAADFSGMLEESVLISSVAHKAMVDVSEEKTVAAAATAMMMVPTSAVIRRPIPFIADHPFLFLIRDNKSGAILFMGRVVNPAAS